MNSLSLSVENADSFESEGVDLSHENSFAFAATASPEEAGEYSRHILREGSNDPGTTSLYTTAPSDKPIRCGKEHRSLEPAVLNQLEKQQNDRFYDLNQLRSTTNRSLRRNAQPQGLSHWNSLTRPTDQGSTRVASAETDSQGGRGAKMVPRSKRTICLSQKVYISKACSEFAPTSDTSRLPKIPLDITELLFFFFFFFGRRSV